MNSKWTRVMVVVVTAAALQACAEPFLMAISLVAGQGSSYTLDSIAYKTFNSSVEGLEVAALRALERMGMIVTMNEPRFDEESKDEAGPKKDGKDEAGAKKAGKDEAGAKVGWVREAGPKKDGKDEASTKKAGKSEAGAKKGGKDEAGAT